MGCIVSKGPNGLNRNTFKVTNVDEVGNQVGSGLIEIKANDLILYQKGKMPITWPLSTLRRYGFDSEHFSFESGRRCRTGAGIYAFRCDRAEQLFNVLQSRIQLNGGGVITTNYSSARGISIFIDPTPRRPNVREHATSNRRERARSEGNTNGSRRHLSPTVEKAPQPRPAVEKAPQPRPAVEKTPQPRPSVEKTPQPRPAVEKAPQPRPAVEKAPQPRPAVEKAPQPRPAVEKAPQPRPSVEKTPQPRPAVEKAPQPRPNVEKTPQPRPAVEKEPQPTVEKASQPRPAAEKASQPQPTVEKEPQPKPTVEKAPQPQHAVEKTPEPKRIERKSEPSPRVAKEKALYVNGAVVSKVQDASKKEAAKEKKKEKPVSLSLTHTYANTSDLAASTTLSPAGEKRNAALEKNENPSPKSADDRVYINMLPGIKPVIPELVTEPSESDDSDRKSRAEATGHKETETGERSQRKSQDSSTPTTPRSVNTLNYIVLDLEPSGDPPKSPTSPQSVDGSRRSSGGYTSIDIKKTIALSHSIHPDVNIDRDSCRKTRHSSNTFLNEKHCSSVSN